ncbi:MAG: outer membrane beta-barrel protein [Bacteroidaceae bacterium]|nr:outer membrane beta-barrel protein [Bacteroidaceae bacterium]
MKKIFIALLLAAVSLGASAQFEKGTKYFGASVSDFGFSYSKFEDFRLGLHTTAGYFLADGWMLLAEIGWDHQDKTNVFNSGISARYYMQSNGLFFTGGIKYGHVGPRAVRNNVYISPEIGYCFFLNDHVSIEPAVYSDLCLNHFKDFTKIGFKVGFGYYF